MTERVAVIGGGSWGTAVAVLLSRRYDEVPLWIREEELVRSVREERENPLFLPGITVPPAVLPTNDLSEALRGATVAAFAIPSEHLRSVATACAPFLPDGCIPVSLTKGIEKGTLLRMTELLASALPSAASRVTALSGPTFAREVASGLPAGATAASADGETARRVQAALSGPSFRVYADTDVAGVEIGGALKNVMAVAAGMSDGLGFGHSARALLVTRGLAEIARAGCALGAHPATFAGLSGMGDLVLTCTGDLSRNRTVGVRLGKGERIGDILASMTMVAEGVATSRVARDLSRKAGVPMPLTEKVHEILHEGKDVRTAVSELLSRDLKMEKE
jgi:glycerol-3-phosphate dehydrogenase (NAD(P)+)